MSNVFKCLLAFLVGLAFAEAAPREAAAQAGKAVSLELNNAKDANGGCRLTYIAMNGTGAILDKASYEIVVFDADAKVAQFLILEFGRLSMGKTKVVEFDFPNRGCKDIKRILVNDVADCVSGGQPSTLCIEGLQTTTRTDIEFGQ